MADLKYPSWEYQCDGIESNDNMFFPIVKKKVGEQKLSMVLKYYLREGQVPNVHSHRTYISI